MKRVRLNTRERQGRGSKENILTQRTGEAIPDRRTNRCKRPGLGHSCLNAMKKRSWQRDQRRGRRKETERWVITKVFRNRTKLRLKYLEKHFEFNANEVVAS